MNTARTAIFAIALLGAGEKAALASGPEIAEASAVAAGTGGASTARSGDPGAAFFNPAALADGAGLRLGMGAVFAASSVSAKRADGADESPFSVETTGGIRVIPNLGASFAFKDFLVGLAVNVPYASSVRYPATSPLRFEILSSDLRDIRLAPFVGVRVGKVRFAAGPSFDFASLEVVKATNHVTEEGSAHLLLDGVGYGFQAAAFAEISERFRLGLSYKSRTVLPLAGNADFEVPPVFGFVDQGVTARFHLPDRIALGGVYEIHRARFLLDLVYSSWSVNEALSFDFQRPETSPSTIKNEWRDTLALRVGAEMDLGKHFVARGGAFVDGIPGPAAPARNLAPNAPDATRVGGSLGAGARIPLARATNGMATTTLGVDVFYSFLALLPRTSTSEEVPRADYAGHAHFVGVGASLHFDPFSKK